MRSNQSGGGDIRMAMFEADAVDCMASPPGQLFSPRRSPTCLWFPARNKNLGRSLRDRRGQALFINARKTGAPVDRARREHRRGSPKDRRCPPHLSRRIRRRGVRRHGGLPQVGADGRQPQIVYDISRADRPRVAAVAHRTKQAREAEDRRQSQRIDPRGLQTRPRALQKEAVNDRNPCWQQ